jgi:hypothetical protein
MQRTANHTSFSNIPHLKAPFIGIEEGFNQFITQENAIIESLLIMCSFTTPRSGSSFATPDASHVSDFVMHQVLMVPVSSSSVHI